MSLTADTFIQAALLAFAIERVFSMLGLGSGLLWLIRLHSLLRLGAPEEAGT